MKETQKNMYIYLIIGICCLVNLFIVIDILFAPSASAGTLEYSNMTSDELRGRLSFRLGDNSSNSSNEPIIADLNPPTHITLARTKSNTVEELDIETYIKGVVAAEMMNTFEPEALKAQAIAIRGITFSRAMNPSKHSKYNNADVCDDHTCCQAYDPGNINKAIRDAVDETKGLTPLFAGNYAETLYFAATMEGTLTDKDVWGSETENTTLYKVRSGPSPEANLISYAVNKYPYAQNTITVRIIDFIKKVNKVYPKANLTKDNIKDKLKVISRTSGGFVDTVQLGDVSISGSDFRYKLIKDLKSANFDIIFSDHHIKITSKGFGHGVGMSQWGANALAKEGKNYKDILNYYFQNLNIEQLY